MIRCSLIIIFFTLFFTKSYALVTIIEENNKYGGTTELKTDEDMKYDIMNAKISSDGIVSVNRYHDAEGWPVLFEFFYENSNPVHKMCRVYWDKSRFKKSKMEIQASDVFQSEYNQSWHVITYDNDENILYTDAFSTDSHIEKTGIVRIRISKSGDISNITNYYSDEYISKNNINCRIYINDKNDNTLQQEIYYNTENKDGVISEIFTYLNNEVQTVSRKLSPKKSEEEGNDNITIDFINKIITKVKNKSTIEKDGIVKEISYLNENKMEIFFEDSTNRGYDKIIINYNEKKMDFYFNNIFVKSVNKS